MSEGWAVQYTSDKLPGVHYYGCDPSDFLVSRGVYFTLADASKALVHFARSSPADYYTSQRIVRVGYAWQVLPHE